MITSRLYVIAEEVRVRVAEITSAHENWPCRKGCDHCCRHLASVPIVTEAEWQLIAAHIERLGSELAALLHDRIRTSASASRPILCPLLDTNSGTCLVYEARPVVCRAYGFYVERGSVLGCSRIETLAEESPGVIWGNHRALEEKLQSLGPSAELFNWLEQTKL